MNLRGKLKHLESTWKAPGPACWALRLPGWLMVVVALDTNGRGGLPALWCNMHWGDVE